MKKTILVFFISLGFISTAFSQLIVPTAELLTQFKTTTTLVVYDPNPMSDYNIKIKEAVENHWKITPYRFISQKEFEKLRSDKQYSFLTLERVFIEKDKTQAQYEFLTLSLGGKYKSTTEMPNIAVIPVAYYGVDEDSYTYKMPTLIQFIQNHIKVIETNPGINDLTVRHYYNKQITSATNKTLLLSKEDLENSVNSVAKIKKIVSLPVKIVSHDDIEEAISNGDDILFLHKVGPEGTKRKARCWITILGAKDAKLYYFNYHMIDAKHPDAMLRSDFKKLAKKLK